MRFCLPRVLPRLQGLEAGGTKYFQDLLSLSPGERWKRKLYAEIDGCDLFLLFWSPQAKASEWVLKEALHALERKSGDELALPEIRPVVIEGPPVAEPDGEWSVFADLHFNDKLITDGAFQKTLGAMQSGTGV